jgi:hypothetical protein
MKGRVKKKRKDTLDSIFKFKSTTQTRTGIQTKG